MRSRFDAKVAAGVAGVWFAMALSGCANMAKPGPQDDMAASGTAAVATGAAAAAGVPDAAAQKASLQQAQAAQAAAQANAAKMVYRVRRGETLAHIAQHHGCSVKELIAWNRLKPSKRLKPGQSLYVASPQAVHAAREAVAAAASQVAAASVPVAALPAATAPAGVPGGNAAAVQAPADSANAREVIAQTKQHAKSLKLMWPAQGSIVEGFQPGATRGIEISGKPGDPVRAAADGRVMYAGTGLNEYGSLIIVQHNKDFLTAYSHNRRLLVKTGDIVHCGQEIAEMGDENNSRVSVLFELRHDGKPIDPTPYLPAKQS